VTPSRDRGEAHLAPRSPRATDGLTGSFNEFWDPAACLSWLDDPFGFVCGPGACTRGALAACVAVPPPAPF